MKFNPLRDWHYAMNVDSPFDQGSSFLMSLDMISWRANEKNYLEAAIEQLQLLDDHYTVYAYPQILTALFELEDGSENRFIIDNFCKKFLEKIKIRKPILNLHEWKKDKNSSELIDKFRDAIGIIHKTESIGGKYKDTFQYRDSSIILSYLYVLLCSNTEFFHTYQSIYNEDSLNKDFLQSAFDNKYGRLSFAISCRIKSRVDHEEYRSNIKEHIKNKIDFNNILTEPDLTELIIQAELFSITDEDLNEISDDDNQLEAKVKNEFYDLKIYTELHNGFKVNDQNGDNYFYHQLFSPIPTSELDHEDLKNSFTITSWQFNLLYCFFLGNQKLSIKLFNKILYDPDYDISYDINKESILANKYSLNAIYKLKTCLNTIDNLKLKSEDIEKIKSSIISKEKHSTTILSLEEIKKHIYSPFPNILRWPNGSFGIERDDSMWFINEDEPFLYLRLGLFSYLTSLYLANKEDMEVDVKSNLLRLSAYTMSFDRFYNNYLSLTAHDIYNNVFEKNNKLKHEKNAYADKPFFLRFGSQQQLIIQKSLAQRTKSLPRLKTVNINEDFNFLPVYNEYTISSKKSKNELYFNLILPDALYYWIIETYLSFTESYKQINFLSTILLHESYLCIVKSDRLRYYYGQINFNQDRLSCLLSFPIENSLNFEYYDHFSFNVIDITQCRSPRTILTARTEEDLMKLLNERTTEQIDRLRVQYKPDLYKSIRILDIIDNESLENNYPDLIITTIDTLYKEISSIKNSKELDRYVRLQLIKLINNTILWQDSYDKIRETIIYLILEYGGIYDIDLLFKALFIDENTGQFSTINQDLQKKFIYGLYLIIGTDASSNNLIESPYKVAFKKDKAAHIRKEIKWLTFSAWNYNKRVILDALKKCSYNEIRNNYGIQNNYENEKQVNTLLTAKSYVYIAPFEGINIRDITAIYYDPNTYTANILTKQESSTDALLLNGKKNKIDYFEQKKWNNLNEIEKKYQENYRTTDWLVDVIGIKSGLYGTLSYRIIENCEKPYPRSMVDLPFFGLFSKKSIFRLVLLKKTYVNPFNDKKGHLWTIAFGINFFIELGEYAEGTLERIEEKIKNIELRYEGKDNPSRGLIAYFKLAFDENENLVFEIEKDANKQPIFDEGNIRIEYNLFENIKECDLEGNEWRINLNTDLFSSKIKIKLGHAPGNGWKFDFRNFSWNPFTCELKALSDRETDKEASPKKILAKTKPKLQTDK